MRGIDENGTIETGAAKKGLRRARDKSRAD